MDAAELGLESVGSTLEFEFDVFLFRYATASAVANGHQHQALDLYFRYRNPWPARHSAKNKSAHWDSVGTSVTPGPWTSQTKTWLVPVG